MICILPVPYVFSPTICQLTVITYYILKVPNASWFPLGVHTPSFSIRRVKVGAKKALIPVNTASASEWLLGFCGNFRGLWGGCKRHLLCVGLDLLCLTNLESARAMAEGSHLSRFNSSWDLSILRIRYDSHLDRGSILLGLSYTSIACLFWSIVLLFAINIRPTEDT